MTEKQIEAIKNALSKLNFTEAKTMKDKPHSYSVLYKEKNKDAFRLIAHAIDNYSIPKPFFNTTVNYLVIEEYQYWSCDPKGKCDLINRALIEHKY